MTKTINLPVFPSPDKLVSRSGRKLRLSNPQALINEFKNEGVMLPVDKEHSIYLANQALASKDFKGFEKLNTGSSGWLKDLKQHEDGSLWATAELTELSIEEIKNKEYLYTSPHFQVDTKTGEINKLLSLSLVKQPDFIMPAIEANNIAENSSEVGELVAFYQEIPELKEQLEQQERENTMTISQEDIDSLNIQIAAKDKELAELRESFKKLEFEAKLNAANLIPALKEQIASLAGKIDFEEVAGLVASLQKSNATLTTELTASMKLSELNEVNKYDEIFVPKGAK